MTVEIVWMKDLFNLESETKRFKDENTCIEWCRKNHKNIFSINGHPTLRKQVDHFMLMDILKRGDAE